MLSIWLKKYGLFKPISSKNNGDFLENSYNDSEYIRISLIYEDHLPK
jgi:hypothetical protein